jgi:hypothetical protein
MAHIIVGIVLFLLGLWGIVANWYSFLDMIWVIVPMLLILLGIVAIVSGINNFSKQGQVPKGTDAH